MKENGGEEKEVEKENVIIVMALIMKVNFIFITYNNFKECGLKISHKVKEEELILKEHYMKDNLKMDYLMGNVKWSKLMEDCIVGLGNCKKLIFWPNLIEF